MAVCAYIDQQGLVTITGQSPQSCTGHVLLGQSDYIAFEQLQAGTEQTVTFQDIFSIPEASVMASAFQAGFSLVLLCYVVSWAYGVVVNFFKPESERY